MARPFLTAKWLNLVVLNWEVEPERLRPLLPRGVTLDTWNGSHFVSLVAFQFLDTRLLGIPIPFHRNFGEINLRFYVKRELPNETRRGVVFIKEFVARLAIAWTARWLYNENYFCYPLSYASKSTSDSLELAYGLRTRNYNHSLSTKLLGAPSDLMAQSREEFILEHYWGYTAQRDGGTLEYQVEHPRWKAWVDPTVEHRFDPDLLYDKSFSGVLKQPPAFVIAAPGSQIAVYRGKRIE